ncbi:phosphoglycerol transferase [Clostridium bornimense]|uniref:Phosphoglycerol transferase n=1 Tax=Clostridium bornimense TaxID=1216932 RepID=W6RRK7_9CLOT|nr:LTA synthase family protein [Clostridium bornimense]CDM67206.1 phosphoglycerol transferase [Clostridium bornimense]
MFDYIANNLKKLKEDKSFIFILLSMFIKTILFIMLISDSKASKINFKQLFVGVPQILVYIAFILIFISFIYLFKNKGRIIYVIMLDLVFSIILIGDLWYYRGFGSFLNLYMFKMTSNLDNLGESIASMIRWVDILFLLDIPIYIWIIKKDKNSIINRQIKMFVFVFAIGIGYISYGYVKIDKFNGGYTGQNLFKAIWSSNAQMFNLSPIGYHIYDSYRFYIDSKPCKLNDKDKDKIKYYYDSKESGLEKTEDFGKFKNKNLIVVQVESLENFVINEKIEGKEITPNLNKLLKNSYYFSNYFEQTLNGTTSDGTFVSNTSMLPVKRGSVNFDYPNNTYNSLPTILKNNGYNTYTMHPEKGSYWNWKVSELSLGFENAYDISDFKETEFYGLGLTDESFFDQVIPKLKKEKTPFYSFMISISSHTPFNMPDEFDKLGLSKDIKDTKLGGYVTAISYTDYVIGKFMDSLDKEGILDNSIVVFYGDHEGVTKFYKDEIDKNQELGNDAINNDRRVPLIIYDKNLEGKEIETYGGQVDFLPTISYLLGIEESEYTDTAMGRNLLNTNQNFVVLTTGEYRGDNKKEKKEKIKSLNISDMMIRSNYFCNGERGR